MVEIGDMPIVWHIMKHLSHYGIKEFVICAGYKSSLIRDFFLNFRFYHSDIQIDCQSGNVQLLTEDLEEWKVTIVDSGIDT